MATRPDMTKVSVQELMQIHLLSDGPTKGWVHTHGLARYGLPELEIRGIPLFLGARAAELLNMLAEYMLTSDNVLKLGEVVQIDANTIVRLEKLAPVNGHGGHYDYERWALVDVEEATCSICRELS